MNYNFYLINGKLKKYYNILRQRVRNIISNEQNK